jgi:hypothetical protein
MSNSVPSGPVKHISDHDLERLYLGMVKDEAELATLEEHLLSCPHCTAEAQRSDRYVDAVRAAIIAADLDLK